MAVSFSLSLSHTPRLTRRAMCVTIEIKGLARTKEDIVVSRKDKEISFTVGEHTLFSLLRAYFAIVIFVVEIESEGSFDVI